MNRNDNGMNFHSYVRTPAPLPTDRAARSFAPPVMRVRRRLGPSPSALFAVFLAAVCAFSLFFALELSRSDLSGETLAVLASAAQSDPGEESGEERLGRLKLIEMSNFIEVFAPTDSPILPLAMDSGFVNDDLTAKIYAAAGSEVFSVLAGTVRSVQAGTDGAGGIVTVAHSGDIEVTYYGLDTVLVERGQPLLQRTVLGTLRGDVLYIRVTKAGRPVDPLEFLGVRARLG
ncbi:MAG: M23 family metallopeptidase [Clostridia bacterium]|nr:M23 family metallopeptidase [Clostridia bacterium]